MRLNLVPDSQRLDLSVNLDEPAGGILSHLANIPDRPPIKLSIIGSGVLDAFNAKLAFDAGQGVGARGDASLNREGAGRRLGLDLAAEVSGLLPQMAAPVFAGTTKLSGNCSSATTVPSRFEGWNSLLLRRASLSRAVFPPRRLPTSEFRPKMCRTPRAARLSRMPRSGALALMLMSQGL